MGELTILISGKLVAFDTAPLIYYIEEHPDYLPLADELFTAFDAGVAQAVTSVLYSSRSPRQASTRWPLGLGG